jgi:hypothetical protein
MCASVGTTKLAVESRNASREDTVHPDMANQVAEFRHAELVAQAAHQRLVDEARQGRIGLAGGRRTPHRWWHVLPKRALATQ